MKYVRYVVPLAVALLFSFALAAAEGGGETAPKGTGGTMCSGKLSAAPAGGDVKVLGVLKTSIDNQDKSLNVLAANDTISSTIKDLVKKSATVNVKGELSADKSSIMVTEITESGGKKLGLK